MNRAAVYIETSNVGALGGAQTHAAVMTDWYCRHSDVDILVRGDTIDLAALSAATSTDLSSARLRVVSVTDRSGAAQIRERYDFFVVFVHELPPVCPAPRKRHAEAVLTNQYP